MPVFQNIIVTYRVDDARKQLMKNASPSSTFHFIPEGEKLTPEVLAECDAFLGHMPPELLIHSKNLKWFQSGGVGVEYYLGDDALPRDVIFTNSTGAFGQAVAEHAFAMLWALYKKLHLYRDQQDKRIWNDLNGVATVCGKTVLLLGVGDIGCMFAKMVKAFACRTIGVRRTAGLPPEHIDEVYGLARLDEMLPRADIVMMSLPGTKETKGVMGARRLGLVKPGAILLNVGRGGAVDTEALCDAVEKGVIGGAGLDVTDPEPIPPEHRMWGIANIVVTPHIAGGYRLQETLDRAFEIALRNLRLLVTDKPPINLIDTQLGYTNPAVKVNTKDLLDTSQP